MKKMLIIVIIVLVAGGAAAFLLFGPKPPEEPKKSFYVPGEFFVTNIKDSKSLLKTTIVLEYNSTKDAEKKASFLEEHNTIIRNEIVFTLREKTEEELRSTDIQDKLRKEIVKKINDKLGIEYIQSIYFNDYVLQ